MGGCLARLQQRGEWWRVDLVPDRMRVVHHPDHLGYSTRERDGEKARIDPPILRNLM